MAEKPCPFCNLDTERNRIIREDGAFYVILSNPRLMPGHVLVVPKKHVGAPFELSKCDQGRIMIVSFEIQRRMISFFAEYWGKQAGCDVSCHTRPFMPTTELTVPGHMHVHLRPRYFKDLLFKKSQWHEKKIFKKMSAREKEKFQRLLRGVL